MPPTADLIGPAEAEAIRSAVARAESASGAEIVPVLVRAVDFHEAAIWKGALIGALAGALAGAAGFALRTAWAPAGLRLLVPVALGTLAGGALAWLPAVRRLLVGRERLDEKVARAARETFLAHEVFATRDRTGLLILVALLERSVAILADSGIHATIPESEWEALARRVAGEMKAGPPGRALRLAVDWAGGLLAARGPRRRADDANELPDVPAQDPG